MKAKVLEPATHPCLVSFPQGIPVYAEDLEVLAGRKGKDRNEKVVVSATIKAAPSTVGLSYKGSNFGDSSKTKNCFKYAIGVVDPSRPTSMRMVPADHPYVLRPSILRLNDLPEGKMTSRLSTASASERRESLTNEFGSKKKKRAMQAMKSNIISAENISSVNELEDMFAAKSPDARAEVVEAAKQALLSSKKRKRR